MALFARSTYIVPPDELVHLQLWNKGTQNITLRQWGVSKPSSAPADMVCVAGPTGNGDEPNQAPTLFRNGTTAVGSPIVTGLSTTADLAPGMSVLHFNATPAIPADACCPCCPERSRRFCQSP